jgi:CheY-like chemotaxis protein
VTAIADQSSINFTACITKPISASKLHQAFINIFAPKSPTTLTDNPLTDIPLTHSLSTPMLDINFAQQYPFQILLVEDNLVNQQILLLMLEKLGYVCEAVDNGLEAVKAMEHQSYNVIFMDIQMPIMDGLKASRNIRQLSISQPWIIGLSANAFTESRNAAASCGMDDYVTKPLQTESLMDALQRVPAHFISKPSAQILDLTTLANLEDSIGASNLTELIMVYLDHSANAIANMKEALENQDLIALESENHSLKGGSATFGATQLASFCQALQSISKNCINSNNCTNTDLATITNILNNIETEYNRVFNAFQSRVQNDD